MALLLKCVHSTHMCSFDAPPAVLHYSEVTIQLRPTHLQDFAMESVNPLECFPKFDRVANKEIFGHIYMCIWLLQMLR